MKDKDVLSVPIGMAIYVTVFLSKEEVTIKVVNWDFWEETQNVFGFI